jgi:hypothetical protein
MEQTYVDWGSHSSVLDESLHLNECNSKKKCREQTARNVSNRMMNEMTLYEVEGECNDDKFLVVIKGNN